MESRLDRIEEKIDKLDTRLDEYNYQLAIHIEGVKQLKEQNQLLREQFKPVEKHTQMV